MFKFSIHGNSLEELQANLDELAGDAPDGAAAAGDKPKRPRKKASAPDPIQPPPTGTAAPAPGQNPFSGEQAAPQAAPQTAAPQAAFTPPQGFAPPPNFTLGAGSQAPQERAAVTQLKGQLDLLASQHGAPSVYAWAIKQLGLSPSITQDDFLSRAIHEQPDEALVAAYKIAGGA